MSNLLSLFYRMARSVASSRPGARIFSRLMHHLDRPVFRLTKGKHSAASIFTGLPIVMLTTTGAKSGLSRTVPLLSLPVAGGYVVIASNWGQRHHPAWYHNLKAHPRVHLAVQGQEEGTYFARECEGAERERLWQAALQRYPGYALYAGRSGGRPIPVILLTPHPTQENDSDEQYPQ